jgi:hypothetical protein
MADVRANSGVPVLAQFTGYGSPTVCAPIVVDSSTGRAYAWKTGDVIVPQAISSDLLLTANQIVIGGGSSPITTLGTLGTTTTVLHGNAAGAPTFAAVSLVNDITGTLGIGNGGTGNTTGTATINANLTGPITSVGNATSIASGNTYPTPTFTGPVTEAPRAASWQFANWNPSDSAGTETGPSDTPTASLTATNYMTMASSSGVLTFTFTKAGNYLVLFTGYITSSGTAYTSFYMRLVIGGTATRYLTPTSIYNQAIDADSGKSMPQGVSLLVSATANQTITLAPKVAVTSGSAASNFPMSAAATAVYTGT